MSGLNSIYNNVTFALQLHSRTLYNLQEQASTGSRINQTSDDPAAAYRVLGLNSQQRYQANFIKNIDSAITTQTTATTALDKMDDVLTQIMVRLTQIISGTYGEGEGGQSAKDRVALEINEVLEQVVSFANTKSVDQYIFGGENTDSIPYLVERSNGEIVSVAYQGSSDSRNIEVASGVQSDITYAGDDIFCLNDRQTPIFYGTTGAAAGTGTSSVKGDLWLTVTHNGTNYELSIGGATTEVTGDITNLAVTNATGEVLYIDATGITATGTERVTVPGTYDVFNLLISTRDLLRNSTGLSDTVVADLMDKAAIALEKTKNRVVGKVSDIGTRINFLESLKDSIENLKINGEDEATMLQEADIAQVAIDISRRQTLYEMSLSIAGKLMSVSLLDFIR